MIVDVVELREKFGVFKDRWDAGLKLAEMLKAYRDSGAIVLAIPAGGVPVGACIAEQLSLELDVAVVSKITLPWNTEAGFGAVAFDGTLRLNEKMLSYISLSKKQIKERIKLTKNKVKRRLVALRGDRAMPDVSGRAVFLVDDGIASGFTLLVAVEAIKNTGASEIIIATPTGHKHAVEDLAEQVKVVYCANVRSGFSFAVAQAYQRWSDVGETQAIDILRRFGGD